MTSLQALTAAEHLHDLQRDAARRRLEREAAPARASQPTQTVVLRVAVPRDAAALTRLAALDDAPAPTGDVLLALVDGDPVAALSLTDGHAVANPFVRTADAVALLRLRARHLAAQEPRRRFLVAPRLHRA